MKNTSHALTTLAVFIFCFALAVALTARGDQPREEKTPALPPPQPKGDLTGIYECRGTEKTGKEYHGCANIIKRGEVYLVSWNVGTTHFVGIGIRTNDILSVGWAANTQAGTTRGVNVYQIKGKQLVGHWTVIPGNGSKNPETLTFLTDLEIPEDE